MRDNSPGDRAGGPLRWLWMLVEHHWATLRPLEAKVAIALLRHANNKTGECWPSVATLGRLCGCSIRSRVRVALRELERRGLVQTRKRAKKRSTTTRWLVFPDPPNDDSCSPTPVQDDPSLNGGGVQIDPQGGVQIDPQGGVQIDPQGGVQIDPPNYTNELTNELTNEPRVASDASASPVVDARSRVEDLIKRGITEADVLAAKDRIIERRGAFFRQHLDGLTATELLSKPSIAALILEELEARA